jgi:beta-galactosidase
VPDEYNPTGAYRTSFTLPGSWEGQEVFLRFEKVASASFVWVNGKEVGYNEGAHEPSEYRITPYLQEGENTIAVFVVKFSDGYYLEGQDYWRLAGIFDDVTVFATPRVRIFDWQVITDLDESYTGADLSVLVDVVSYDATGSGYRVNAILQKSGTNVATIEGNTFELGEQGRHTASLSGWIGNPEKWTSETPALYDLTLELLDSNGNIADRVETRMGFKETEIRGNTFYLNGVPIKLHAINSHMQHPENGHVMEEATIRKDFEILKQFNFNAVRTSHYPPSNRYLQLADEYGIYIIDEAGTEAHASEYVSQMPEFTEMYRERVRKMVLRDRNYPCVLFWSAGNESGEGDNIAEVIKEGKRLDPTRYWMYGGNAEVHYAEEIIGPRYPSPLELEVNIGLDTAGKRPSFMDEYLSIAGNGGGGMDDYWRVIYAHPRSMGGAIWDFVSTGITEPVRRLEDSSPHGTFVHIMGKARLVTGYSGKGIDLNGHDQWVEVYRDEQLEMNGDQLTLVMDLFPRSLNSSSGSLITKGSNQFGLRQLGKETLEFYIFTGERVALRAPLPEHWENNWHHLMARYDGKSMNIFIDGAERASMEVNGEILNLPYPVNIGRDVELHGQDLSEYLCDAVIDNVGIFSKAFEPGAGTGPEDALLWLDFEKEEREGTFFSYGIGARTYGAIWPDRRPQPEMWQMKKSAQPLSFKLLNTEDGWVEVWNRSNFSDASFWETTWTLTEDETVLQSGTLDLNVEPQGRGKILVPFTIPEINPGKEYRLNISSALRSDELWAKKGFEVSWDQFELKEWYRPSPPVAAPDQKVVLSEDPMDFILSGERFRYRFDRKSGMLKSMVIDGEELLVSPLMLNVWRAPIANELDSWNGGTFRTRLWKEGYGTMIATDYYSSGIHDLRFEPLEVRATGSEGKIIIHVRELALVNGGREKLTVMDRYRNGKIPAGFESVYTYTVSGNGDMVIDHTVMPQGTMPQMLPRIGVTLMLDRRFENIDWYGRGPQENYPDRSSGYPIGIYHAELEEMYEPYLIPQDHGLRTDNRWVRLTDQQGRGVEFSMDATFHFNAYPFTTENLTRALYPYQLEEAEGITLNLDYSTTGVGCTARPVLEAHRAYPERYTRQITIKPINQ